jgi:hypothetical protein
VKANSRTNLLRSPILQSRFFAHRCLRNGCFRWQITRSDRGCYSPACQKTPTKTIAPPVLDDLRLRHSESHLRGTYRQAVLILLVTWRKRQQVVLCTGSLAQAGILNRAQYEEFDRLNKFSGRVSVLGDERANPPLNQRADARVSGFQFPPELAIQADRVRRARSEGRSTDS